jgi:hypothetical protein
MSAITGQCKKDRKFDPGDPKRGAYCPGDAATATAKARSLVGLYARFNKN